MSWFHRKCEEEMDEFNETIAEMLEEQEKNEKEIVRLSKELNDKNIIIRKLLENKDKKRDSYENI